MNSNEEKDVTKGLRTGSKISLVSMILIIIFMAIQFIHKSDRLSRGTLPVLIMSDGNSISSARTYLEGIYGKELVSQWKASVNPEALSQDDEEMVAYPKQQIDYLLQKNPSDFPLLHQKYLFTTQRIVRFAHPRQKSKEAIDIYLDSHYRVYGLKHHYASGSLPTLSENEVLPKAMKALAQIATVDTAALTLVSMEKHRPNPGPKSGKMDSNQMEAYKDWQNSDENPGFWHLQLRDEQLKLKSKMDCGYKVTFRGEKVNTIMPYTELASEDISGLNNQKHFWRRLQQIAYIFLCLYIISGLVMLFRDVKRNSFRIAVLVLAISNLFLDTFFVIEAKSVQIFGGDSVWIVVLETVMVLSVLLVSYGKSNTSLKPYPQNKIFQIQDITLLILLAYNICYNFMDIRSVALMRFIPTSLQNQSVGFLLPFSGLIITSLMLMGMALYYRKLQEKLSKVRFGKTIGLLIALGLSTAIIVVINPQIFSIDMYLISGFSILSLSVMLHLMQYDFSRYQCFHFALLFIFYSQINNPIIGTYHEDMWWMKMIQAVFAVLLVYLFSWLLVETKEEKSVENKE